METQRLKKANFADHERRAHLRKTCDLHIDFDDFKTCHQGIVTSISRSGVFIRTPAKNKIGSKMSLTIPYKDYSRYLVINGTVTRMNPEGIGVAFAKS